MKLEWKGIFPPVCTCRAPGPCLSPIREMTLRGVSSIFCLLVLSRADHCLRSSGVNGLSCDSCCSSPSSVQKLDFCRCSSLRLCREHCCMYVYGCGCSFFLRPSLFCECRLSQLQRFHQASVAAPNRVTIANVSRPDYDSRCRSQYFISLQLIL